MNLTQYKESGNNPFDSIKHTNEQGNEFWLARELMVLMGYSKWDAFLTAIEKAIENMELVGDDIKSNASDYKEPSGKTNQERLNYQLSRYGAYMVALACDGRKPEVALAKKYFAVKTREAEIFIPRQNEDLNELEKLRLENENLKLKLELEASKIALNMMKETLEKNENTIKQSMELISIQEEKNFENNYYLTKLVEIKDESLLFSTLLDLKWEMKMSGYTFPTVSYTIAELINLFSLDLNTRKVAPFISKIFILDHKNPPSKKEITYKYNGDNLLYPITVFKILTDKEWKEFRDCIEIDYRLRFPTSNRKFFPHN